MKPWAYYNENDAAAAEALRALMALGLIPPGHIDTRSIKEVLPDDLAGFVQHHFFAGCGGWPYAARLAGWPDHRPLWTASCPCQPFSAAGKGAGVDDPRHLWPDLYRLWRAHRPSVGVGEQVAGKAGYGWFDGVRADLARENYASRTVDIPALAVDAPHQRNRLYWIAVADTGRGGDEPRLRSREAFGTPLPSQGEAWQRERGWRDDRVPAGGQCGLADADDRGRGGRPEEPERGALGRASVERASVGGEGRWRVKNDRNQERYHRIRREVLLHYGGGDIKCACCGERQYEFLALDHINGGGAEEKRRVGSRMRFRHLQIAGYPAGYQVLCHNCNQAKHIYGECPHRSMGDAEFARLEGHAGHGDAGGRSIAAGSTSAADGGDMADRDQSLRRLGDEQPAGQLALDEQDARTALRAGARNGSFWSEAEWIVCHDGKARRTKPGLRLLVNGMPGRIDLWRLAGNGIVLPLAAEVLASLREAIDAGEIIVR